MNGGYLLVHFTGEHNNSEQIYMSISKDGLHYTDLNNNKPIITSNVGEKGLRDPYIVRSCIDGRFYIISTDLRIENGLGWGHAVTNGSKDIIVCDSDDLINWSEPKAVRIAVDDAGCTWAPECIYDKKTNDYLVFFASMTPCENGLEPKHRIFAAHTRDFYNYGPTFMYIERENHVIDTTIIEHNGTYYRFSKDETNKNIRVDYGTDVSSQDFTELVCPEVNSIMGVEGPIIYKFNGENRWCLMLDQFATNGGYMPLITTDIASGHFTKLDEKLYNMGASKKRHGSILAITDTEIDRLTKAYNVSI